jgi:hypothetical protein
MIIREHKTYNQLIISMLDKLSNINQWRKDFILETFVLFLSIRGRINFLQLARYGKHVCGRHRHIGTEIEFAGFFSFIVVVSNMNQPDNAFERF